MFTPGLRGCAYKTASGLGKWPNHDPLGEPGFEVVRGHNAKIMHVRTGVAELTQGPDLYEFVNNAPIEHIDYLGLEKDWGPVLDSIDAAIGGVGDVDGILRTLGNACFELNAIAHYVDRKHEQCIIDNMGSFPAQDKCDSDYKKRTDFIEKAKCKAGCP